MLTLILKTRDDQDAMLPTAHTLRGARIVREWLRHFPGITFPDGPAHRS